MSCTTPRKKPKDSALPADKGQNVQVFVRCRPLNTAEKAAKSFSVVDIHGTKEVIVKGNGSHINMYNKEFHFDRAFGAASTQPEVYSAVVAPLISQILQGYNCTVFAYGQTGTGKTYTMEGVESKSSAKTWEMDDTAGIIPQSLCQIFDELKTFADTEFSVRVSFLELYNEEIFDLLSPAHDTSKLRLFEDSTKKGSVIIQGLEEVQVKNKSEVHLLLEKGSVKRKTAETLMNANSSRSHTVFTVTVHVKEACMEGEEVIRVGKLNLVDLAGSENVARSGASGGRAREAGSINTSLLTLGRVITCLVERTPHIPYRESKLTRLLQDSLGGKTKTSIIATISPSFTNVEETLSTLEYAQRAKNITNRPEVNVKLSKDSVLKEYNNEIDRLRQNLLRAREGEGVYLAQENYQQMLTQIQDQAKEMKDAIGEMRALKQEMDNKVQIFEQSKIQLEERNDALAKEQEKLGQLETTLSTTKADLQKTARERDLQIHLVEKRVETETKLGQQARKLLVVCDQNIGDVSALHAKLERVDGVETENQNLQDQFLSRFQARMQTIGDRMQLFQEEYESRSAAVREKMNAGLNENDRQLEEIVNLLTGLVNQRTDDSLAIQEETGVAVESTVKQKTEHREVVLNAIKALHTSSGQFKDTAVETFVCERLKKLIEDSNGFQALHDLVVRSLESMSASFLTTLDTLTGQLINLQVEVEEKCARNEVALEEMQTVNTSVDASMEKMKEALEALQNTYNQHFKVLENKVSEKNELVGGAERCCEDLRVTVENQRNLHDKQTESALAALRTDSDKKLGAIRTSVSGCEERTVAEMKLQDSFKDAGDTFIKNSTDSLKKLDSDSQTFYAKESIRFDSAQDKLKASSASMQARLVENKENLAANITNNMASRAARFTDGQADINDLSGVVGEVKESLVEKVGEWEEETLLFVSDELKKDVPTGRTPGPKERTFPRVLAATSPHQNIVERYRRQESISEAVELPLDISNSDSAISRSTRGGSLAADLAQTGSGRSSRSGSTSDLMSEADSEVFKVPTGIKKPEIFYKNKQTT